MLKIKTDSNNQIDIENKSIEVSDRVSADGAVTITAKAPTEIKIIKATAAKAIITDKGETPITTLDATSVRRVYNVIRSPIAANIEANRKDANSGLPNGKYGVMFHIYGDQLNFPGAVGANEEDSHIVITLNLDSGMKFYKDVVPFLKKTKEWKSMEALYGKYFDFNELVESKGTTNHAFTVEATPHPTEEHPKVVSTTYPIEEMMLAEENGETDFELALENNTYEFIFRFHLKVGCDTVDVDWMNYVADPNSEIGSDDPIPSVAYTMYSEANETIGSIVNRFKALHPELDYESHGLYTVKTNIKMPPVEKVNEELMNTPAKDRNIMFLIENEIDFKLIDVQNSVNNATYKITVPAGSRTISNIYNMAVDQHPEIGTAVDAVNAGTCVRFNTVYQPMGLDSGNRISWGNAFMHDFIINTDRYPGEYLEMYIDAASTPVAEG